MKTTTTILTKDYLSTQFTKSNNLLKKYNLITFILEDLYYLNYKKFLKCKQSSWNLDCPELEWEIRDERVAMRTFGK